MQDYLKSVAVNTKLMTHNFNPEEYFDLDKRMDWIATDRATTFFTPNYGVNTNYRVEQHQVSFNYSKLPSYLSTADEMVFYTLAFASSGITS